MGATNKKTGSSNCDIEIPCKQCGIVFATKTHRLKYGVGYCSEKCYHESQRTGAKAITDLVCLQCLVTFTVDNCRLKKNPQFCSVACKSAYSKEHKFVTSPCKQCGKEFRARANLGRQYCSRKCAGLAKSNQIDRECKTCGVHFTVTQGHLDNGGGKYCSYECAWTGTTTRITCNCRTCGKSFEVHKGRYDPVNGHYCSMKCLGISQRGPNYAPAERKGRAITKWRTAVYERDGYLCQRCRDPKHNNLNAHHVLPWVAFPEERFNVDNGVTLCRECHEAVHDIIGWHTVAERFTPEQYRAAVFSPAKPKRYRPVLINLLAA